MPSPAAAADYTPSQNVCGGGDRERGSGQRDASGTFYLPCEFDGTITAPVLRPHIKVIGPDGALQRTVPITFPADGKRGYVGDVAPSPDGAYLYVVRHETHTYHRLNRQADGSYVLDPFWRLANYTIWGAAYRPDGEFIATDQQGSIYVTTGTWTGSPTNVAKYRADGSLVTNFGDWERSHAPGRFYWMLGGLAVTPDGGSIYTVEVGNNRVQRFDRRPDGTYGYALEWGNNAGDDDVADNPATGADESRPGICYTPGKFAAPYDVALDGTGDVYVVNTTCFTDRRVEVQRFTRDGVFRQSIIATSYKFTRVHGLGVDARGSIYLPQAAMVLTTGAPVVQPPPAAPANQAPTLRGVTAPARTTVRGITVGVDAIDDVAVVELRIANENEVLAERPWQPFAGQVQHVLSDGSGAKVIRVQVRDAAGAESGVATADVVLELPAPAPAPVANQAPVLRDFVLPTATTTQVVTITIDAVDDGAVTQMRYATETGNWEPWRAFATPTQVTLTPFLGIARKGISLQVRDAQLRESGVLYRMTNYQPAAVQPAPEPAPAPEPVPAPAPAPAPLPVPPVGPNQPPVITGVKMPNPTATQLVPVHVDATDDRGIVRMRVANENGIWQAWQPWKADFLHLLTPTAMMKGITVEVRDADGAVARSAFSKTLCKPCTAPVPMVQAVRLKAPMAVLQPRLPVAGLVRATSRSDRLTLLGRLRGGCAGCLIGSRDARHVCLPLGERKGIAGLQLVNILRQMSTQSRCCQKVNCSAARISLWLWSGRSTRHRQVTWCSS